MRLQDQEPSKTEVRTGGQLLDRRSSPDGQQDIDRGAAQHQTLLNITAMTDTETSLTESLAEQ